MDLLLEARTRTCVAATKPCRYTDELRYLSTIHWWHKSQLFRQKWSKNSPLNDCSRSNSYWIHRFRYIHSGLSIVSFCGKILNLPDYLPGWPTRLSRGWPWGSADQQSLKKPIFVLRILIRWPLKALIDGAHTASCGKEFHLETTLSVKKWCRVFPLLYFLMSLSECPLSCLL